MLKEVRFRCYCCCSFDFKKKWFRFRGIIHTWISYLETLNRQTKDFQEKSTWARCAYYTHILLMEATLIRVSIIQECYAHFRSQSNPLSLPSCLSSFYLSWRKVFFASGFPYWYRECIYFQRIHTWTWNGKKIWLT